MPYAVARLAGGLPTPHRQHDTREQSQHRSNEKQCAKTKLPAPNGLADKANRCDLYHNGDEVRGLLGHAPHSSRRDGATGIWSDSAVAIWGRGTLRFGLRAVVTPMESS